MTQTLWYQQSCLHCIGSCAHSHALCTRAPRSTAIARLQDGSCLEQFVSGDRKLHENHDLSDFELKIGRVFNNRLGMQILLAGCVHDALQFVGLERSILQHQAHQAGLTIRETI